MAPQAIGANGAVVKILYGGAIPPTVRSDRVGGARLLKFLSPILKTFFKVGFLKLLPPWVTGEFLFAVVSYSDMMTFLFARRNLVWALTPLYLGLFSQTKVLRTPKIMLFPVISGFFCRKVRARGGCHAQIRRRATKGG
eukprot:sb/3474403/